MKILLSIIIFLCGSFGHPLLAQDVIQLTDNNYADQSPRISGGNVVWVGGDASTNNTQIYYYHLIGLGPSAVTDTETAKFNIDISGDKMVWNEATDKEEENTWEVHFFDFNASDPILQLTDNSVSDKAPRISGNDIVWYRQNTSISFFNSRIFHYDLDMPPSQTNPIMIADDGKNYGLPKISGNHVAFTYADGSDSEVVYYNLDTQAPALQLTSTNVFVYNVQLSNNKLWWNGWHGDIHYFDLEGQETPTLIHDVDPNGYSLYLDADDQFAVWSRYDIDEDERDIFYYELNGQNTPIRLTDDEINDTNPIISGGYIIWERGVGEDTELFYFDLINQGPIVQLTDNDFKDGSVEASNNKLVWQGGYLDDNFPFDVYQDSTLEVFTANLPELITATKNVPLPLYQLNSITPNPVSDQASIEYSIAEEAHVSLLVSDSNGKTIEVLTNAIMPSGQHQAIFDVEGLLEGVYFVTLVVNNSRSTKRIVVIN